MKSRLQPAMNTLHQRRMWRYFWLAAIVLIGVAGAAFAQDTEDPPGRVGYVSLRQGGYAAAGTFTSRTLDSGPGASQWQSLTAQTDLPSGTQSGLRVVEGILDGIEDVSFNRLTSHDVVRHRLVGKIVAAYDEFDARRDGGPRSTTDRRHER